MSSQNVRSQDVGSDETFAAAERLQPMCQRLGSHDLVELARRLEHGEER